MHSTCFFKILQNSIIQLSNWDDRYRSALFIVYDTQLGTHCNGQLHAVCFIRDSL